MEDTTCARCLVKDTSATNLSRFFRSNTIKTTAHPKNHGHRRRLRCNHPSSSRRPRGCRLLQGSYDVSDEVEVEDVSCITTTTMNSDVSSLSLSCQDYARRRYLEEED